MLSNRIGAKARGLQDQPPLSVAEKLLLLVCAAALVVRRKAAASEQRDFFRFLFWSQKRKVSREKPIKKGHAAR